MGINSLIFIPVYEKAVRLKLIQIDETKPNYQVIKEMEKDFHLLQFDSWLSKQFENLNDDNDKHCVFENFKLYLIDYYAQLKDERNKFELELIENRIDSGLEFHFENDLAEAKSISDLRDRLFWWKVKLKDYERLIKYKNGEINIIINIGGMGYEEAVKDQIDFIETELKERIARPAFKPKILISYKAEKYSLSKLFKLIKGNLIDKNTAYVNFKEIFTGYSVNEISPLKWHDGNASELLYFITQLMELGFIPMERRLNYQRLKTCFVKYNGASFIENFKELKQSLEISLSPEKKLFIDKILRKLSS